MRKHGTENGIFVVSQMTEGISEVKRATGKIWLNSQSWSVISGMGENGQTAMDSVNEYLDTD